MSLPKGIKDKEAFVTPHYKFYQLACPCCGKFNFPEEALAFLERVTNIFAELRGRSARALPLSSAMRCLGKNTAIGGSKESAHLDGLAFDFPCSDSHLRYYLVKACYLAGAKGLEVTPAHVHADIKDRQIGEAFFFPSQKKLGQ